MAQSRQEQMVEAQYNMLLAICNHLGIEVNDAQRERAEAQAKALAHWATNGPGAATVYANKAATKAEEAQAPIEEAEAPQAEAAEEDEAASDGEKRARKSR